MKYLKFIFIHLFFFTCVFSNVNANQNIAFADIDLIIKTTKVGKSTLDKINQLNNSNIEKLKTFEKEIKDEEDKINKKKNLISNEEFQKEINELKKKLNNFNLKKNEMVDNFKITKTQELENLFKIINPVIQDYMKVNSIGILLNSKNIFMGRKEIDLTQQLIKEIDNKIK